MKYAQECKARRVVSIHLQVGELRDVVEEWVQRYFDYLSEGTIAEGSKLVFKRTPAVLKCSNCGRSYQADVRQPEFSCPDCGSTGFVIVSGREFVIESIGVI